jgi:hypothetical protein
VALVERARTAAAAFLNAFYVDSIFSTLIYSQVVELVSLGEKKNGYASDP